MLSHTDLHRAPTLPLDGARPVESIAALRQAFDELDYGVMLLTASGRLVQSNEIARTLLEDGVALRLAGEHVVGVSEADQSRWMSAMRDAHRGMRRLVFVGPGDRAVPLALCPLVTGAGLGDGGPAPALVMAMSGRCGNCETLSVSAYGRARQLTPAELDVLSGLVKGLPPQEVAVLLQRSAATVRCQIRAILAKTESASIRTLLQTISRLPPIRPPPFARVTSARAGCAG
jgi:DNA-binding CsgD family transcriptional regulator